MDGYVNLANGQGPLNFACEQSLATGARVHRLGLPFVASRFDDL
jgi:hypothetical protein